MVPVKLKKTKNKKQPLWSSGDYESVWLSVPVVSRCLGPRNRTFLEGTSMVVTWWIAAFLCSELSHNVHNKHTTYSVFRIKCYILWNEEKSA